MPVAALTRELEYETPPIASLAHLLTRLQQHTVGGDAKNCGDLEQVFVQNGWWWALTPAKMEAVFWHLLETLKQARGGQARVPDPSTVVHTLKLGLTINTLDTPFPSRPLDVQLSEVVDEMTDLYTRVKETQAWAKITKAFFSAANLQRLVGGLDTPSERDVLEHILGGLEKERVKLQRKARPPLQQHNVLVLPPSPTAAKAQREQLVETAKEKVARLIQDFNRLIDLANTPPRYQPQVLDARSLSHRQRAIYGRRRAGEGGAGRVFA
ncbi:hypothetical protein JCM6882_003445 [Rhodosporidiobolus microsporus]